MLRGCEPLRPILVTVLVLSFMAMGAAIALSFSDLTPWPVVALRMGGMLGLAILCVWLLRPAGGNHQGPKPPQDPEGPDSGRLPPAGGAGVPRPMPRPYRPPPDSDVVRYGP